MIASDLQVSLPTVNRRTSVVVAARLIVRADLAVLVLADDDGTPAALVAAADVLRLLLAQPSPSTTVGDLLDDEHALMRPLERIDPSLPLDEVAAAMATTRAPIAVVDDNPRSPRFVLLALVLDAVLASRDEFDLPD